MLGVPRSGGMFLTSTFHLKAVLHQDRQRCDRPAAGLIIIQVAPEIHKRRLLCSDDFCEIGSR